MPNGEPMDAYGPYCGQGGRGDTRRFYFRSEKSRLKYVVEAVYHREGDFYAVKFHARAHSASPRRYGLATNTGEPFRILRTCMQILPRLLELRPGASFVAVGARSTTEGRIEDVEETVRFRMYKRHLERTVPDDFAVVEGVYR